MHTGGLGLLVRGPHKELKRYLVSPPILVAPRPREPLRLYLEATPQTASSALVAEREGPAPSRKRAAPPKEATRGKKATPAPPQEDLSEPQEDLSEPQEDPSEPRESLPEQSKDCVEPQEASSSSTLVEHLVYFVNTVLRDARERYPVQ